MFRVRSISSLIIILGHFANQPTAVLAAVVLWFVCPPNSPRVCSTDCMCDMCYLALGARCLRDLAEIICISNAVGVSPIFVFRRKNLLD